jgi:phosphoglycolate phosphatase
VRAAIIDLDGTMLDTVPDFHVAINGMREELGLRPSRRSHQADGGQGLGKPDPRGAGARLRCTGVEQRFEQAMDAYQRHYLAINGDSAPCIRTWKGPGGDEGGRPAPGLRHQQADRLRPPLLKQKTRRLFRGGLRRRFAAAKKPDPLPLLQVCADFDLAPAGGGHRRLVE